MKSNTNRQQNEEQHGQTTKRRATRTEKTMKSNTDRQQNEEQHEQTTKRRAT
jgi:hypothetical protein